MTAIGDLFRLLGPWNWVILAVALFVLETVLPGVNLLWFGLAAMVIGAVAIAFADFAPDAAALFTWQWQLVSFAVLAVATVFFVRRYASPAAGPSDEPGLNTRSLRYVGRVFTVAEPIVDGRGKVRVGDGLWLVEGPDVPAGTRVKVVGVNATVLIVEPIA